MIVRLDGEFELVSAVVSDMQHRSITASIGAATKPNDLPTSFALAQNYPNPFNPMTILSFTLQHNSDYELTIFNVNGQKVRTFTGNANAGRVELTWDASDNASGIYFYKLTAGSFTATKKMMLLK